MTNHQNSLNLLQLTWSVHMGRRMRMHLVNYLVALLVIYDILHIHHKWKLIELSCHILDCFLIIRCEGNKQNKSNKYLLIHNESQAALHGLSIVACIGNLWIHEVARPWLTRLSVNSPMISNLQILLLPTT